MLQAQNRNTADEPIIPISGRRLTLPAGNIFHVQRANEGAHVLGEFRAWAAYKTFGCDEATDGLVHFQHVLSCGDPESAGRTGVHCHLAHAHIVIPVSGVGTFSYDGVETQVAPGSVIVQHGGTIHDQFEYSYAPASFEDNCRTPLTMERPPAEAPVASFGFLELFVPLAFANVEIVAPGEVTPDHQASAWRHPYHLPGARFALQTDDAPEAVYRPLANAMGAGVTGLEIRDAGAWEPSAKLVATWIVRPGEGADGAPAIAAEIAGETGGVEIFFMLAGSANFRRDDGQELRLECGDAVTLSQGGLSPPMSWSPDLRLLRFFIAARAQELRRRTDEEIAALEALGPAIIQAREIRQDNDQRPINCLQDAAAAN